MNTESRRPRRVLRSVLAVLAGIVAVILLSIVTDMALVAIGTFPSLREPQLFTTPMLLLATVYRSLYGIAGSYIAAMLAPRRPMAHALAIGGVGFVAGIAARSSCATAVRCGIRLR
jgi:hypothetical protein